MAKAFNDKRYKLGQPYADMMTDFMAANYGAPAVNIMREAVKELIERRLEEPDMKRRYERARKERLGLDEKVVKLVDKKD